MRSEEKLYINASACECKFSQENTILLQENTNVLRVNAEFLEGEQYLCKSTQKF